MDFRSSILTSEISIIHHIIDDFTKKKIFHKI